jgi:D-lactate dehydrogenase
MPRAYSLPKALVSAHSAQEAPGPAEALKVVYFPSCLNQMMGLPKHPKPAGPPRDPESACAPGDSDPTGPLENSEPAEKPLVEEMVSLLHKAGYQVIFPSGMSQLCCGTIWESKGMPEIAERKVRELENALWAATEQGRYPVLCDQSPCLHRMRTKITRMKLYEPAEFILTFLRNRLDFHRTDTPVAVHLTCSTRLMEVSGAMLELARLCSSRVVVPEGVGCCGFAGDKGMTHPELNAYALRKLRDQVRGIPAGYSNSRTCEIGLTTHSGIPYRSIAYLVNRCTTAKR